MILDWVPAHFPRDEAGLYMLDGTPLYNHPDPKRGEIAQWGTMLFDFGRGEVCSYLLSNACFWLEMFHADGLRVDAVSGLLYYDFCKEQGEWLPNEYGGRENIDAISFLRRLNETVYHDFAGVMMIAEEASAYPMVTAPTYLGGLGFGFKWNMGWMNDILELPEKGARSPALSSRQADVFHVLRVFGKLCAAVFPRRGGARQAQHAG